MTTKVLVLIAMLGVAREASADAIYTYTGHTYTDISDLPLPAGSFDTSMQVTGAFVLADALAPGMPSTDITPLITSFTFSNSRTTLTNLDLLGSAFFSVATDAFGAITAWAIVVGQDEAPSGGNDVVIQTLNDPDLGFSAEDRGQLAVCDPALLPRGLCLTLADVATVADAPGVWTTTTTPANQVPEPGIFSLCALALWAVGRRRAR